MSESAVGERAVIDRAGPADLDAIMVLERAGFDEASRWSAESWTAELAGADRCVLVAGRSGHGELSGVATFQVVGEVADLHRIMVAPDHRGRGIGRALIEAGLAWVGERQGRRVLLEVEQDNAPALALYRRLGFVGLARRKDYYGAGRHALVMQCDIAKDHVAGHDLEGWTSRGWTSRDGGN